MKKTSAAKDKSATTVHRESDRKVQLPSMDFSALTEAIINNFSTALLLIASFLIGMLWTEVRYLKKGGGSPTAANAAAVQQNPTQQAAQPEEKAVPLTDEQWKQVTEGGAAEVGKKNAPVVMVEYSDFQCPYCSRHYKETYKELVKKYVDSGKMRIIFRDLPLSFHPNAKSAAVAARCAGEQGKYVQMHDALFEKQQEWANLSSDEAKKKYKELAANVGVNAGKFNSCVDSDKYAKQVEDDLALASKLGASGTPTFFINKEKTVGALPFASFSTIIEGLLK